MPPALQIMKDNLITTTISLVSTIGFILGTFLVIDERYAHAIELNKLRTEQKQLIMQQRYDLRKSTTVLRKQTIEDKIFEIEVVPSDKRSPVDNARLERYKRELIDADQILRQPAPVEVIQ